MNDQRVLKCLIALGLGAGGLALLLTGGCTTLASRTAPPLSKGPYLQAPGTNTMTILWESPTNHPGTVLFGREGRLEERFGPVLPRRMVGISGSRQTSSVTTVTNGVSRTNDVPPDEQMTVTKTNRVRISTTNLFYVYQATLSNLVAGAVYSYAVALANRRGTPRTFKTFSDQ